MTWLIMRLTFAQLVGQRRSLLILLFAAIPPAVSVVYRLTGDLSQEVEFTAQALLSGIIVAGVLPLVSVILGTSALGTEFEESTAVYLLSKPIPRSTIVGGKLLAAWLVCAATVGLSAFLSGAIALGSPTQAGLAVAFTAAVVLGAFVYCALFLALSIFTGRALIVGLLYAFLWEGVVSRLFAGTRILSVRQYTMAIADALSDTTRSELNARLSATDGLIGVVVAAMVAVLVAVRLLQGWETGRGS